MTIRDDLLAVADLLEPEGAWCQVHWGEDVHGHAVSARSPKACRWCIEGAIQLVSHSRDHSTFNKRGRALQNVIGSLVWRDYEDGQPLWPWNDRRGRTQAEVIALVRRAAESAQ